MLCNRVPEYGATHNATLHAITQIKTLLSYTILIHIENETVLLCE